jgi:hypothetical protein
MLTDDLLDANESTRAFDGVARVDCALRPHVDAFVSLANATGRWRYCGRIADADFDEIWQREQALAMRGDADRR